MGIGKTLKGLLGAIAPTVATAIGGPLGGVAMKFVADKFTDGDTGKVEDFLLSANPEQLAQLKLADKEFDKHMADLGVKLEEIAVDDRKSARDLAKTQGMLPQVIISAVYSLGYFFVMYMFITGKIEVPQDSKVMFGGLIGVLSAAQVQIMNFWFGSSAGSKAKTNQLAAP